MDPKKIGDKLRELRGDRSQREVAEALNISESAVSMYECGERMPRDEVKLRFARYYNTTVEGIFFDAAVHE